MRERKEYKIMRINIPENAKKIIDVLYDNGYEAYVVGGCVRDSLLGLEPKDWDITTSAAPQVVKSLFKKTIDTGIEHGTVTVMYGKEGYEVTTYRIDGEYKDSRRPESVEFTSDLAEDLLRRDFSINAMAYNDKVGVVDKFDGIQDLERKIIRCVGVPTERFTEDALRILRAVRFSAQLGFEIEEETRKSIVELAPTLANISAERIKTELDKTLMSENPCKIHDAYKMGITKVILPEYDSLVGVKQETVHHMYDVDEHTIVSLKTMRNMLYNNILSGALVNDGMGISFEKRENIDCLTSKCVETRDDMGRLTHLDGEVFTDKEKLMLMWTMLLHDIAKPNCKYYDERNGQKVAHFKMHDVEGVDIARGIFNRLKFDNYTSGLALKLIRWHDYRFTNKEVNMRKAMNKIGVDIFDYLFLVKKADTIAQHEDTVEAKLSDLAESYRLYKEIIEKRQCVCLKDLAISGNDLIKLGVKPGREIGQYLDELLKLVIEEPELNTKEILTQKFKVLSSK